MEMKNREDSQASATHAGLGGVPLELARGRHATEAGPLPPASRGLVPDGVASGTAGPSPVTPLDGDGPAQSPEGAALMRTAAAPSGSTHAEAWEVAERARLDAARCPECQALPPNHLVGCVQVKVPDPAVQRHRPCGYPTGSLGCRMTCGSTS